MKITGKTIVLSDHFNDVRQAMTGEKLMGAAKAGGHVIEGHAKVNAGSGRPGLNRRTGHLVGSISVSEGNISTYRAEVDVGTNVIYARIHELGGIIRPVTARMLSWINDAGERVFANLVHIPARPYLRPAMDENEKDIVGAVEAELWRSLDRATS